MTYVDGDPSGVLAESRTRTYVFGVAIFIVACFVTVACQLRMLEFSNGGENAVVESVQELRRNERTWAGWLSPTLHDELRTKKPPLPTWLSALVARQKTVTQLSARDPGTREQAYHTFAGQVRLPALLAMCGLLVATCALGYLVGDRRLALLATIVCGSSFFWLRNARLTTTDVQLALWVTVANALLADAVFRGRTWLGLIGGGVALGLAMMSKGPVGLLQSAVPVLVFVAWRRWRHVPSASQCQGDNRTRRSIVLPLLIGLAAFGVVGLSWYIYVLQGNPWVLDTWWIELTREGATQLEPSRTWNYVQLIPNLFPWSFFFIAGLIGGGIVAVRRPGRDAARVQDSRIVLPFLLVIVPILVMSFFRDREIRYLIPLVSASALLAAWGILQLLGAAGRHARRNRWLVVVFHWLPLFGVTAGLLLLASPLGPIKTIDGRPWYSLPYALIASAILAVLTLAAAIAAFRRWPVWGLAAGTAAIMLPWNVVLNDGYQDYVEGRSEMRPFAEHILAVRPDAKVYSFRKDRPVQHAPIDLAIYLNRVIQPVSDPMELAGTSGPRVYVVRQPAPKHGTPAISPAELMPKAGGPWRFFGEARMTSAVWYAFMADTPESTPPASTGERPQTRPAGS